VKHPVSRRAFLAGATAAAGSWATCAIGQSLTAASSGFHGLVLGGIEVTLWITPITNSTLRLSVLASNSSLEPDTAFTEKGLRDRTWPKAATKLHDAAQKPIEWGDKHIAITSNPIAITVQDKSGSTIQILTFDDATGKVSFDLHDKPLFGFGEGGHQFDRRGVVDQMRNGQFKPDQFLNGGRSPIPWFLSPAGWAIFFHHPEGTFDLTGKQGIFRPSEPVQPQDIFLIVNPDPKVILKEFAQLSGLPHLPPIWALGYQQSHRTLASRESVLAETKTFREKKLPCDVMIYLGTGFAPSGWNTGHGSFAFNTKIFPDPKVMFDQMHADGFRVILHVLGVPFDLHGRVPDHSTDPDNATNYWQNHLEVLKSGNDGWWVDDGDELLPQARLDRNRMYWEGSLQQHPNLRPFSIQRNGYAGLQQYGFLWSGDVNSEWKTLRTQIAAGLNTGLSGIPYWGTDTGGFFSTKELTAELYVRWFQFSVFCPLFRSHGRTWMLRLPWGWNMGNVGPVEDDAKLLPAPEDLHHAEVEDICRKYLNLRYQLLPYLYSTIHETTQTGLPIMRALWLAHPTDSQALAVDDAYMWGESLLVAPVTTRSATDRSIYLPTGTWTDYWTGEKVTGGATHTRPVDLATLPLYVKSGSIIPLGPIKQYTLEQSPTPLELHIYPGADAYFALYEDDGVSMDHTRAVSSTIEIRWSDQGRNLSLALAAGSTMHPFTTRRFTARFAGSTTVKSIDFSGTPITVSMQTNRAVISTVSKSTAPERS
jgi:alpha-glucosidase/alpha-D-xyloside xylohydrolase